MYISAEPLPAVLPSSYRPAKVGGVCVCVRERERESSHRMFACALCMVCMYVCMYVCFVPAKECVCVCVCV